MGRASVEMMDKLRQRQLTDTLPKNRSLRMSGLKKAIMNAGITQAEFADVLNYSPTHMSSFVTGREGVPLPIAEDFSYRLEIPLSELIADHDIRQYLTPVGSKNGESRGSRPKGSFISVDAPAMRDAIQDVYGNIRTQREIAENIGVSQKTIGRIFQAASKNSPIRFRREIVETISSKTGVNTEDFFSEKPVTQVVEDDTGIVSEESVSPEVSDTQVETIFQALDRIEQKVDHIVEMIGIEDDLLLLIEEENQEENVNEREAAPQTSSDTGWFSRVFGVK